MEVGGVRVYGWVGVYGWVVGVGGRGIMEEVMIGGWTAGRVGA